MDRKMVVRTMCLMLVMFLAVSLSGCAIVLQKRSPSDVRRIRELERIREAKEEELKALNETKAILERKLRKEIGARQIHLEMAERGLIITFVDEILFDSGKAKIKSEAVSGLDKIAEVILEEVPDRDKGLEGHTENQPLKYSGWQSNWELSTARATSVLHYLVDEGGFPPEKVSPIGYGEYKPVASNATKEGRRENRRVEIIILPKKIVRVPLGEEPAELFEEGDEYIK